MNVKQIYSPGDTTQDEFDQREREYELGCEEPPLAASDQPLRDDLLFRRRIESFENGVIQPIDTAATVETKRGRDQDANLARARSLPFAEFQHHSPSMLGTEPRRPRSLSNARITTWPACPMLVGEKLSISPFAGHKQ